MNQAVATTYKTKHIASKAFAPSPSAPCRHSECKSAAAVQLRQQSVPLTDQYFSCWLALRAGVLRRAVSSWVRPLLQHGTSSVSVGRLPLRPPLPACPPRSCAFARPVCSSQTGWVSTLPPVRPNRSLNRTHCGVPPFGLENPSPNAATPQRSG